MKRAWWSVCRRAGRPSRPPSRPLPPAPSCPTARTAGSGRCPSRPTGLNDVHLRRRRRCLGGRRRRSHRAQHRRRRHLGGPADGHRRRPLVGELHRRPARLGLSAGSRPARAGRDPAPRPTAAPLARQDAGRPDRALTNASFVDATHGWIGTADGHVLKTTDGGATWQTLDARRRRTRATSPSTSSMPRHGWAGGAERPHLEDGQRRQDLDARSVQRPEPRLVDHPARLRRPLRRLGARPGRVGRLAGDHDQRRRPLLAAGARPATQFATGICAASATNVWLVGEDMSDYYDSAEPDDLPALAPTAGSPGRPRR